MRSLLTLGVIALGILTLFGCKKEAGIIEYRIGVTKIDYSIPTDYDIVEFSVVTENLCFAIGKENDNYQIFKTTNGGTTWSELTGPVSSPQWDLEIQSIVFFDDNNGAIALNNKAYRTYDGGQTWTTIGTSDYTGNNYVHDFCFVGKNEAGEMVIAESNGNSWYDNHIYTSVPSSTNYNLVSHFQHSGIRPDYCSYSNGRLHYITRNFNFWDEKIYVYDFNSGILETLNVNSAIPLDVKYANGRTVFARETGKINFHNGNSQEWNVDYYNFHDEDYPSIEFIDDFFIAVANRSITVNYNGVWEEVINIGGTGHTENFMKVQKINNDNVYISGEAGLFIKVTIK